MKSLKSVVVDNEVEERDQEKKKQRQKIQYGNCDVGLEPHT